MLDIYKENQPGTFYVDTDCIACDTCVKKAPNFFSLTLNNNHAFVKIQPKKDHEIIQCRQALAACPVSAIGEKSQS